MEYQPESNRLLYAQLLADCARGVGAADRGISFVSKSIRGTKQWYLQLTVGSSKTQHYLGPDSDDLRAQIAREKELWSRSTEDRRSREKLVAMLQAGGAAMVSAAEARVFELLQRAGVFLSGGSIIGSHAFGIYANMLGVRWKSETTRTQDLDLGIDPKVRIGIGSATANLREALLESEMGFFEVPALNRKHPSTKFMIRGRKLTVELLTPMRGRPSSKPILIPALGTPAEPMRFLEYLLEETEPAAIVARAGIPVNVPSPSRYALHKLVVWRRRPPALQTKALKDLAQAGQLIALLANDRPGDLVLAWEAAQRQPPGFQQQLKQGITHLPESQSRILKEMIGMRR